MICVAAVIAGAVLTTTVAQQIDSDSIRSPISTPLVATGGVMMVPLVADGGGATWPPHIELDLDDGRSTTGHVAWLSQSTAPPSSWTQPPGQLVIRAITPDDASSPGQTIPGPFLLAWMPKEYQGSVAIGDQVLTPRWAHHIDLPPPLIDSGRRRGGRLGVRATPNRPDTADPLAYWRWVLVAHREMVEPPPPPQGSAVEVLAALHGAQSWSIGLDRLAKISPGVARECLELLGMTVMIDEQEVAAWVTDPTRLNDLLSLLLDTTIDDTAILRRTLQWCDVTQRVLTWFENPLDISTIKWRLANAGASPSIATIVWSSPDDIALAVEVAGGDSVVTEVDRPSMTVPSSLLGETRTLPSVTATVAIGPHAHFLQAPAPVVTASPPGVTIGPLLPPMTLDEVRHRRRGTVATATSTVVHLRKSHDRWELVATCRRPGEASVGGGTMPVVGLIPESVRGHEAISLMLRVTASDGTPKGPGIVITIPEIGPVRGNDRGLAVIHRRSHEGRWVTRIELPWQWIPPDGDLLSLAVARTHGGSMATETGPVSCFPWHLDPSPIHIDLSQWDTIDRIPLLEINSSGL
jgi:hypothetical protein